MRFTWISCLLLATCLVGCGGADPQPDPLPDPFREAQLKWHAKQPSDYRFTLDRSCHCPPALDEDRDWPLRVVVRDGKVVSATHARSGLAVEPSEFKWVPGMHELFQMGEKAYALDHSVVAFVANTGLGYLERISIDHDTRSADDEIKYLVADLQAD